MINMAQFFKKWWVKIKYMDTLYRRLNLIYTTPKKNWFT